MQIGSALWDLAVGRRCLACGQTGPPWCDRCLAAVVDVHSRHTPGGVGVLAAARYAGPVRSAVVAYKERGHLTLAVPLGRLLAVALPTDPRWRGRSRTVLVPIPSSRAATRLRGHDHARRLAQQAGAHAGVPTVRTLRWRRVISDQAGLTARERRRNVSDAMVARPPAGSDAAALLVDDIMTTGATLDEGHRALTSAGWLVGGVAVVAAVDARRALAPRHPLRYREGKN
jgi:predicted amidophosphoribosyltransferase